MLKYKWLINGYFTELEAFDHMFLMFTAKWWQ